MFIDFISEIAVEEKLRERTNFEDSCKSTAVLRNVSTCYVQIQPSLANVFNGLELHSE